MFCNRLSSIPSVFSLCLQSLGLFKWPPAFALPLSHVLGGCAGSRVPERRAWGGNSSSRCVSFLNSLGSAFGKGTIQSSLKQLRSLIVVAQLWIVFLMLFFFPSNLLL